MNRIEYISKLVAKLKQEKFIFQDKKIDEFYVSIGVNQELQLNKTARPVPVRLYINKSDNPKTLQEVKYFCGTIWQYDTRTLDKGIISPILISKDGFSKDIINFVQKTKKVEGMDIKYMRVLMPVLISSDANKLVILAKHGAQFGRAGLFTAAIAEKYNSLLTLEDLV